MQLSDQQLAIAASNREAALAKKKAKPAAEAAEPDGFVENPFDEDFDSNFPTSRDHVWNASVARGRSHKGLMLAGDATDLRCAKLQADLDKDREELVLAAMLETALEDREHARGPRRRTTPACIAPLLRTPPEIDSGFHGAKFSNKSKLVRYFTGFFVEPSGSDVGYETVRGLFTEIDAAKTGALKHMHWLLLEYSGPIDRDAVRSILEGLDRATLVDHGLCADIVRFRESLVVLVYKPGHASGMLLKALAPPAKFLRAKLCTGTGKVPAQQQIITLVKSFQALRSNVAEHKHCSNLTLQDPVVSTEAAAAAPCEVPEFDDLLEGLLEHLEVVVGESLKGNAGKLLKAWTNFRETAKIAKSRKPSKATQLQDDCIAAQKGIEDYVKCMLTASGMCQPRDVPNQMEFPHDYSDAVLDMRGVTWDAGSPPLVLVKKRFHDSPSFHLNVSLPRVKTCQTRF